MKYVCGRFFGLETFFRFFEIDASPRFVKDAILRRKSEKTGAQQSDRTIRDLKERYIFIYGHVYNTYVYREKEYPDRIDMQFTYPIVFHFGAFLKQNRVQNVSMCVCVCVAKGWGAEGEEIWKDLCRGGKFGFRISVGDPEVGRFWEPCSIYFEEAHTQSRIIAEA